MTLRLMEVHRRLFSTTNFSIAPPERGREGSCWRFVTLCTEDLVLPAEEVMPEHLIQICPLMADFWGFAKPATVDRFREMTLLFEKLFDASINHNLKDGFGKAMHDVGEVIVERSGKNESHKIIQAGKKTTLTRIHNIIDIDVQKVALITHCFLKPANSNKTPKREQDRCAEQLQKYFNGFDGGKLKFLTAQNTDVNFQKLFS